MSNQFIIELRKNSKRGSESKWEKGWPTQYAPIGYLNDKENHIIINDPERFDLVKKMWDMMLSGQYGVSKILNIVNDEWGFRTRKTKKQGGKNYQKHDI